jgi:hypothetical protein
MIKRVDLITIKTCQLIGELDRLFLCELDGWLPIHDFELEIIYKAYPEEKATIAIEPIDWPAGSRILAEFYNNSRTWRLAELTITAPHIHNTVVGGIFITLPICDLPGIKIGYPKEAGSPIVDIITNIISQKYPTPFSNSILLPTQ